MEEWKTITDWPIYEVSSFGRIRNKKTGYILKPWVNGTNYKTGKHSPYLRVTLGGGSCINSKQYVHRVTAKYFCPQLKGENQVHHIDRNPMNNQASNLEWCSSEYNLALREWQKNPDPEYEALRIQMETPAPF